MKKDDLPNKLPIFLFHTIKNTCFLERVPIFPIMLLYLILKIFNSVFSSQIISKCNLIKSRNAYAMCSHE